MSKRLKRLKDPKGFLKFEILCFKKQKYLGGLCANVYIDLDPIYNPLNTF